MGDSFPDSLQIVNRKAESRDGRSPHLCPTFVPPFPSARPIHAVAQA
ncbi:hypothetical protein [Thermoleptolyngbya sp. M55_K2018_002]|nr:hypothetical protein [Thermoleptolyngbya sp. M55_K2018_002]HIK40294.1 hypothetical protein [Thermoleptolyngbya sp. M55_K2018_002]